MRVANVVHTAPYNIVNASSTLRHALASRNVDQCALCRCAGNRQKNKITEMKKLLRRLLDNPFSLGTMCQLLENNLRFREPFFFATVRGNS